MTSTESTRTPAEWEHLERSYDAAYLARRAARLASAKARKEPLGSLRTDDKATRAPEPKVGAVALPRVVSGLLSGIHGKLSTKGKWIDLGNGAWTQARVQDSAPMVATGGHIAPASVPADASHASVQGEIGGQARAARLREWTEAPAEAAPTRQRAREDCLG